VRLGGPLCFWDWWRELARRPHRISTSTAYYVVGCDRAAAQLSLCSTCPAVMEDLTQMLD